MILMGRFDFCGSNFVWNNFKTKPTDPDFIMILIVIFERAFQMVEKQTDETKIRPLPEL